MCENELLKAGGAYSKSVRQLLQSKLNFVLGLIVDLSDRYIITSNLESK